MCKGDVLIKFTKLSKNNAELILWSHLLPWEKAAVQNSFFDHVYKSGKGGKVRIYFRLATPVNALKKQKISLFLLKGANL